MKVFAVDTHVHTCLSPCGDLDMHPAGLVGAALDAGLDAVAVCDHNSAANLAAVGRAGRERGLAVIPGMEITSEEEVHVLALMPHTEAAQALQAKVYASLPGKNDPRAFGMQVIADEHEEVLGFEEHLLAGATTMNLEEVVDAIHRFGGLAVAAHVDREGFGILGQLGMIPPGLALDGLELSPRTSACIGRMRYAPSGEFPFLQGSDAHEPKDVGRAITFLLAEEPNPEELGKALAGCGGRMILGGGKPMEDLSLHILDVARNSFEAGAKRVEISLSEDPGADSLTIEIADDGRGMDAETLKRATDPFFTTRTTRRVGLGLPLLAEAARAAGGSFEIRSEPGRGTALKASFKHGHIDRAPLGDIETTLLVLLAGSEGIEVVFRHSLSGRDFEFSTRDIREALGEAPLSSPEGLQFLRQVIRAGELDLHKAEP